MEPRLDGYYRSSLQRREDWHAGVQMVEEFYGYLKLFPGNFWLIKNFPTLDFDFAACLSGVSDQTVLAGVEGRHAVDEEIEFLHRTGRYSSSGNRLEFEFRHFLVTMNDFRWVLRMESPERLLDDEGTVYLFVSVSRN